MWNHMCECRLPPQAQSCPMPSQVAPVTERSPIAIRLPIPLDIRMLHAPTGRAHVHRGALGAHRHMSHAGTCEELAALPCVFILALGRSGSSHLVQILHSIPGYRISGETDNAWVYLARFARLAEAMDQKRARVHQATSTAALGRTGSMAELPLCETWRPYYQRAGARATNLTARCRAMQHEATGSHVSTCKLARETVREAERCNSIKPRECINPRGMLRKKLAHSCPVACGACRLSSRTPFERSVDLCEARRLLLAVHNPEPRARVFGFKEIYSPWVRRPWQLGEIFDGGIGFIRGLFPRAKFILHWRENVTRIAGSDFWQTEGERAQSIANFKKVVRRYEEYVDNHPDHAFATTLEGVTVRKRQQSQLRNLFKFLGEPLTARVKAVAREHLALHDWSEETHMRRVPVHHANGSTTFQSVSYAWSTSSQARRSEG